MFSANVCKRVKLYAVDQNSMRKIDNCDSSPVYSQICSCPTGSDLNLIQPAVEAVVTRVAGNDGA